MKHAWLDEANAQNDCGLPRIVVTRLAHPNEAIRRFVDSMPTAAGAAAWNVWVVVSWITLPVAFFSLIHDLKIVIDWCLSLYRWASSIEPLLDAIGDAVSAIVGAWRVLILPVREWLASFGLDLTAFEADLLAIGLIMVPPVVRALLFDAFARHRVTQIVFAGERIPRPELNPPPLTRQVDETELRSAPSDVAHFPKPASQPYPRELVSYSEVSLTLQTPVLMEDSFLGGWKLVVPSALTDIARQHQPAWTAIPSSTRDKESDMITRMHNRYRQARALAIASFLTGALGLLLLVIDSLN